MLRTAAILIVLCATSPSSAIASVQAQDSLEFGGREYAINQQPMLGYWHDAEWKSTGTRPFPMFQVVSSNNWRGYDAAWSISDGQLWLDHVSGVIEGRRVKDDDLILDYEFPARVDWFSGRIYLPVGEHDNHTGEYSAVVVLHIKQGMVKKITFFESARLPTSWNGLEQPVKAPKPKLVSSASH